MKFVPNPNVWTGSKYGNVFNQSMEGVTPIESTEGVYMHSPFVHTLSKIHIKNSKIIKSKKKSKKK